MALNAHRLSLVFVLAISAAFAAPTANAEDQAKAPRPAAMKRLQGVWVEGPGFDITYGGTYEACAARCLGNSRCVMIEYYRPQKKCNQYDSVRPRIKGGESDVAIRE